MKPKLLPAIAVWVLDRFHEIDPALAGDLLEELQSGRTSVWFWWQFTAALGIGLLNRMRRQVPIAAFSAAWSIPLPVASFYLFQRYVSSGIFARITQLDWPWSALGTLALESGFQLFLLWTGTILYAYLHYYRTKQVSLIQLFCGLLAILPILTVTSLAIQRMFPPTHLAANLFFVLTRLPFFLSLFFSILIAVPRPHDRTSRIA